MTHEQFIREFLSQFQKFFLLKWPFGSEICLCFFVIRIAFLNKKKRLASGKDYFWAVNVVLLFLAAFGGGTIAPMMLGKPPFYVANDLGVPMGLLAFTLIELFPLDLIYKAFQKPAFEVPLVIVTETFRVNSMIKMVNLAHNTIKPTYYPGTSVFGPIVIGIIASNFGGFMPLNVGLSPLESGVSFNIQSAAILSTLYHLVVNDPYVLGGMLRGIPLLGDLDEPGIRCVCVIFFVLNAVVHTVYDPHFNILHPVHDLVYAFTGIDLPESKKARIREWESRRQLVPARNTTTLSTATANSSSSSTDSAARAPPGVPRLEDNAPPRGGVGAPLYFRKQAERWIEIVRLSALVALLAVVYQAMAPQSVLRGGEVLKEGEYLATCTAFSHMRSCSPYIAVLEDTGALTVYRGTSPHDPSKAFVWTTDPKRNSKKLPPNGDGLLYTAVVDTAASGGVALSVRSTTEEAATTTSTGSGSGVDKVVWTSPVQKKTAKAVATDANANGTAASSNTVGPVVSLLNGGVLSIANGGEIVWSSAQ